jgi:hypothetical protein
MKDNSTGKDKEFYSRGKQMFDEINTDWYPQDKDTNERFAQRVSLAEAYRCGVLAGAEAEREACAKVCEGRLQEGLRFEGCAAAIRARGNT